MHYTIDSAHVTMTVDEKYHRRPVNAFLADMKQPEKKQRALFRENRILLNGNSVKDPEQLLMKSDALTVLFEAQTIDWAPADTPALAVWEDPFLSILHKDAGRIIHGDRSDTHCLNAQAAALYAERGEEIFVRPLHRLDRETQGLVLYSRLPFFQPWFDACLCDHSLQRCYIAVTSGTCAPGKVMTIRRPIGRDRHVSGKYRVSPSGKEAVTKAECLSSEGGITVFRCILETGRTHQIRVHLSDAGYPILNDPLYGIPSKKFRDMGLWADRVIFRNPLSRKKHRIKDTAAPDFSVFLPI